MSKRFELHVSPLSLPKLELLNPKQCEMIHHASLEVLRRTGVRVHSEEALELLQNGGAMIDDQNLVRIPPGAVEWALTQAPSSITLCSRESDKPALRLTDGNVYFGPGSDCPRYLDPYMGEARKFSAADVIDCIHIVDALPQISFVMSMGMPSDLDQANVYRHQFATMLKHTTKPIIFVCNDRADCEAVVNMASVASGGIDKLRLNPNLLLYAEPTSPLQHSQTAVEKLLYMAGQSLPIVYSPAPMMGGTAPATLAGGVVQSNVEILSGLVIHQLKNPGSPFVYGSGLHHMDMKTTIIVYGAPEFQLARAVNAQLGRFYNLPIWGYAGHSDSKVLDEQAAADAVTSVMMAFLTGTHLAHDVGYLESGATTSPEMIVFTAEVIEMLDHFMDGISLNPESLALEVIHRVGPSGHYLTDNHTLQHFRKFWQPTLFDRQRAEDWIQSGRKRLGERLREKTIAIMEEHSPPSLPERVKTEIDYILNQ